MLTESGLLRLWREVYAMTADVTPLSGDCGQLCDSICCQDWDEGVGMYLYPGEELLLAGESWLTRHWHPEPSPRLPGARPRGAWFVTCEGYCPREMRPFACRTFPLIPHMRDDGGWKLILDPNGLPICPLIQMDQPELLLPSFRATMKDAWRKLLTVEEVKRDVMLSSRRRTSRV
ncbi:MAG: hypothetical protein ACLFS8_05585 [Clostridia bacterium]